MRLIDADALRAEYQAILDRGDMFCEYDIVGMVDDAPTVDAIPNKEGYEMYNKGYMSGYERGKEDRPQGEWIEDSIYEGYMKCSNCNSDAEWLDGGGQFLPNFCPYCGADMGGGTQ